MIPKKQTAVTAVGFGVQRLRPLLALPYGHAGKEIEYVTNVQ